MLQPQKKHKSIKEIVLNIAHFMIYIEETLT